MHSDVDECRRANRDQDMRAEPAAALTVLALSPNEPAEYECGEETDKRIEEIANSE
jgi:hypothetical protein